MVPVYGIVSFFGLLLYMWVVYIEVLWNVYETLVIASFFALACSYVAPSLREQQAYFATIQPKDWPWPLSWLKPCVGGKRGILKRPTNGLIWINILWIGIFQYCLVKAMLSIAAVVAEFFEVYCASSSSPGYGHIWILCIEGVSVTISKYCLLTYWKTMKPKLSVARHTAKLQLVCIMLVIYLTFWQNLLFTVLFSSSGAIQPTTYISFQELNVAIPILVLDMEMLMYSIMHLYAYSWKEYRLAEEKMIDGHKYRGFWRAVFDACNAWDIVKAVSRSVRLLWIGHGACVKQGKDVDRDAPNDGQLIELTHGQATQDEHTQEAALVAKHLTVTADEIDADEEDEQDVVLTRRSGRCDEQWVV